MEKITKIAQDLAQTTEIILQNSEKIVILNQDDFEKVQVKLKDIKITYQALESERKKVTIPLDNAKKVIMDWFRKPLEKLVTAENIIKKAILRFQEELEIKRQEELSRLKEKQNKEAERLRKLAESAENKGKENKAESLRDKANLVEGMIPLTTIEKPKFEGITPKILWKFRVLDINKVPRDFLIIDETKLNKIASATKGTLKIEGIEFYSEKILVVKTKK